MVSVIARTSARACRRGIAPRAEVRVDHLTVLINRAIDIGPPAMDAGVGFVNPPLSAIGLPMRRGSLLELWMGSLHPGVDGAAIDDEPTLGEPLDDIRVAQAIADIPPHRYCDHIIRERMVRKGTG